MKRRTLAAVIASVLALIACGQQAAEKPAEGSAASTEAVASAADTQDSAETLSGESPVIDTVVTRVPEALPPINRDYPARVIVEMETTEKVMTMTDGVEHRYWTSGGDVPGQMIHVREGDTVEVHFSNHPTSTVPHNVDFHAATGTGGDTEASFIVPGHISTFSLKILQPGLYIYHRAVTPVGMHITNGIYGPILVKPKDGLPKVDKELHIVQDDFYTKGKYNDRGLQDFDMDKIIKEQPEYVVFNGHIGSTAGDNAPEAKTGEKIHIFVGNGSPNLVSSFHVIGEILDTVHVEGGDLINRNTQTVIIPAGGAAIVDFKVDIPGSYTLVGHSTFRAPNKDALGQLKVEGEGNPAIMTKRLSDIAHQPTDGAAAASASTPASVPVASAAPAASSKADNASK